MLRARLAPAALALALLTLPASALAAFKVDGKAKVSFFAEGSPGALDIEGKSDQLALADDGTTLTFTVPFTSVTTGIDLRDQHMKEKYLHVDRFPDARLSFPRAALQLPTEVGQATSGTVAATFHAHGVDQPVSVVYTLKKSKTGYAVDATFEYNASNHGIEIPSYLGVTVAPEQSARVRFDMIDE